MFVMFLGHVSVWPQSCLGRVSVMFRWCLPVTFRSCLGGVSVMLGGVWLMLVWCAGCVIEFFCLFSCLMFSLWRTYGVVVSRSESLCVYEMCTCMCIHKAHIARWRSNITLQVNVSI